MRAKLLAAWTGATPAPPQPGYPPYINASVTGQGVVDVTMRQSPKHGAPATIVIEMTKQEWLAWLDDAVRRSQAHFGGG